ncbi:sigma-70 region 4 domain-containing protein [Paradesulfitobacterium ferrireducens]|uniref:sigma-70 region 4 domain-containing protein n=1 Tax=Paradesulfitobacterium ferrireducens TaxID=2816476 RepID=UPI001F45034E|nr:sigma-70 region 4 domain-containing protein [Paradesulfitobacterium ferrireducens]
MTDDQRQKIKMLRYQGFGYKKIADEVGLSRDSVRGYCLRNGLGGCGGGVSFGISNGYERRI